MDDSTSEPVDTLPVLTRAVLAGLSLGSIVVVGANVVLAAAAADPFSASVLLATCALALAVGIWAGAPDLSRETLPVRERWLAAAAITATAGAFTTFAALYEQIFPGPWWRVAALVLVLALPVYVMGLLLPVLVAWADRWLSRQHEAELPWVALGPVVLGVLGGAAAGSLLTTFVLLPRLAAGSILMAFAVLLLIPNFLADPAVPPAPERELHRVVTPYGSLEVTEVVYPGERQPERRLYLNGEEESGQLVRSGAPTLAYIAAAESWLAATTPAGSSYLFLGGGAYTLPRRIAERDARAEVTVVELDPEVTRLARRFFGLRSQHGIRTLHGDARAFLERPVGGTFDRIYVDVYSGHESLPHSMVTRQAAASLAARLAPGGVVAVNLIGDVVGEERQQIWSVVRTYTRVFPSVTLYTHLGRDFPERQNLLLAASMDPDCRLPATAGHFERWPREEWPPPEGTTIFSDLEDADAEGSRPTGEAAREAS